MKKLFFSVVYMLLYAGSFAQNMPQKIEKAYQQFEADSQLRHAISSLYIINAKTGEIVFDRNSQIGLAPASTQKIITAVTAFVVLGKDFRYETDLLLKNGEIVISGSGDPTLGSWRYRSTTDTLLLKKWSRAIAALKDSTIHFIKANDGLTIGNLSIPKGYIWEDIGNYYGAGTTWLNWHENQYDISFESGRPNELTRVIATSPKQDQLLLVNNVTAGENNTGDNAYVYCAPFSRQVFIDGTIPPNQRSFSISASMPDPAYTLAMRLRDELLFHGVYIAEAGIGTTRRDRFKNEPLVFDEHPGHIVPGSTHYSPALDSIIYWFLQKSVNLYGESLVRSIGLARLHDFSIDSGVLYVKRIWKYYGIDENEVNISDGSGLSPQNRVTTHAQVEILKYAKTKDWFPYFYNALPTYNGMKMKSGSIRDVKAYCGYQQSADGNEYIFSFIVNNYSGRSSAVVSKMFRVLDVLK
ncbi:MAG TPA: D-alanyl-D-alanine carboxypeptidase/D-alanyl-D-alanine-endopeptidase [Chitinophagaceae bacterium]|nr:D-alanyl-D-alanine carboxypeptidase/D-alanyl-D-alanine-endopeptidase [Chitinophagaceae bacterium]